MNIDEVIMAHLKSAEARFNAARISALFKYESSLLAAGTDADEIAARVEQYANELLGWHADALMTVAGAINNHMLKASGSTVGIEQQSGMRH